MLKTWSLHGSHSRRYFPVLCCPTYGFVLFSARKMKVSTASLGCLVHLSGRRGENQKRLICAWVQLLVPAIERWCGGSLHTTFLLLLPSLLRGAGRQPLPGCWFSVWWLLLSSQSPFLLQRSPDQSRVLSFAPVTNRDRFLSTDWNDSRAGNNLLSAIIADPSQIFCLESFLPLPSEQHPDFPASSLSCLGCAVSQPRVSWCVLHFPNSSKSCLFCSWWCLQLIPAE